jgi:Cu2+-exporting ATPase
VAPQPPRHRCRPVPVVALPLAAGLLEPIGRTLRPEIAAISMSGSSILVALNAVALKHVALPRSDANREGST